MKVALVHDWLTGMRGGEKVLEVLCEIFPQADLFTLIHNPGSVSPAIENRKVTTSFIQKLPLSGGRYRFYLPLFPIAIEGFRLNGYDLIVSTSHCAAKGVIPPPGALHISYIYTPMRYVWDMYDEYFGDKKGLGSMAIRAFSHYLRMWDVTSSSRVDHFVAISSHVARRVEKYYRRSSSVIYPPADCSRFGLSGKPPEDFYLILSAFAPYKKIDLAIEAFNSTGLKLKIIGSGQDEKRLRSMARGDIEFLGWRSDVEIAKYYSDCKALIFPGEEDFGIVPLEAMASGRPVVAYGKGGALETVVDLSEADKPPTGVFFSEQTPGSLMAAVRKLEENYQAFNPAEIRTHALRFDRPLFKKSLGDFILARFEEFKKKDA